MSTDVLAPPRTKAAENELWRACGWIALGLGAMLLLFREEVSAALEVWKGSTAYNHCFLIIPIVGYLIWDRRTDVAGSRPRPTPAFALFAIPLALAWLVAERLGVMEARQLLVVTLFELLVLCVLGKRIYWQLWGPLLYLYFLVPFGNELTPVLQDITAWFVMHGLDLLGIANYTDGLTIQIPEGTFVIAEACAGLRFLIASIAFGCLYALLIYRSPRRRFAFIAASLIVPVIANGFRALGIVTLGHILGSAQAAETDHVLYGWIFFSIVILLLIVLGLPFRQDHLAPRPRTLRAAIEPANGSASVACSAALVVAFAAAGPIAATGLTWAAPPPARSVALAAMGPCRELGEPLPTHDRPTPGRIEVRHFACADQSIMVQLETFSARAAPRVILHERDRLSAAWREDVETEAFTARGLPWRVLISTKPPLVTATLLWSEGRPVQPGLSFRLRQGWQSIAGGGSETVLLVVTPEAIPLDPFAGRRAISSVTAFLANQADLPARLAAFAPQ